MGHFCIIAKSNTILPCHGCTAPQDHSPISRSCGIIPYHIGIIRCDGIFITESTCRTSFDRTGSNLLNFIAIGFCRFRNGGGTNRIAATDNIGIIPIDFVIRTDS